MKVQILIASATVAMACVKTKPSDTKSAQVFKRGQPAIEHSCAGGEAVSFILESKDTSADSSTRRTLPAGHPFKLKEPKFTTVMPANQNQDINRYNIQFDACLGANDELALSRLIVYQEIVYVFEKEAIKSIAGLEKAVFEQDSRELRIKIDVTKLKDDGKVTNHPEDYLITGYRSNAGDNVIAGAWILRDQTEPTIPILRPVIYGSSIIPGAMSGATDLCGPDKANFRFRMGEIEVSGVAEFFLGTSGSRPYEIRAITIKDPSQQAGDAANKSLCYAGDKLASVMQSQTNHHNVCDSMVLTLPHATYGITAGMAGNGGGRCPSILEGAPQSPPADKYAYQIKYSGGDWTSPAAGPCKHFIYCKND